MKGNKKCESPPFKALRNVKEYWNGMKIPALSLSPSPTPLAMWPCKMVGPGLQDL